MILSGTTVVDEWLHRTEPAITGRPALFARTPAGWTAMTYGDVHRMSRRVAVWLAAQGVGAGDRVAIVGDAGPDWVVALFGVWRRGALVVPLDAGLGRDDMAAVLDRARPRAVIADRGHAGIARGLDSALSFDRLATLPDGPEPEVARDPHDAAMIVWTSGTTGTPKGVTLSLANIAYVVDEGISAHDLRPGDRWLSVLPLNHMLELSCGLLPALATGAAVTFAGTTAPARVADIMSERGCTRITVVPRLLAGLVQAMEGRCHPGHRPTLHCGGAPLDAAVAARLECRGVPVYTGYGLTETAPTVAMNTPGAHRPGSVGRPLPGTEVRIEGAGDDGEILVRSPGVMLGYCGNEALTGTVLDDAGWFRTGDLGHLDADGFLYVTGRTKSLIVLPSGKKVQPEEVERVLSVSDLLAESCVVGWAPPGDDESVWAVVVGTPDLLSRWPDAGARQRAAEAEVARLTAGLAAWKRPAAVTVVAELPRTAKRTVRRPDVVRLLEMASGDAPMR
ncbi:MAG: class I adenylate-forming enzyme family protein [Acidimicrobiales bacterium]